MALIGPPIMPMPENARRSDGIAWPSSTAINCHGSDCASSHSAKYAGPSVWLKRKIAIGRMGRQDRLGGYASLQ